MKVTDPMMPGTTVATVACAVDSVPTSTAPATSADAPPPNAFSSATISGIAVIWIVSASVAPIAEPRTTPAIITPKPNVPPPNT